MYTTKMDSHQANTLLRKEDPILSSSVSQTPSTMHLDLSASSQPNYCLNFVVISYSPCEESLQVLKHHLEAWNESERWKTSHSSCLLIVATLDYHICGAWKPGMAEVSDCKQIDHNDQHKLASVSHLMKLSKSKVLSFILAVYLCFVEAASRKNCLERSAWNHEAPNLTFLFSADTSRHLNGAEIYLKPWLAVVSVKHRVCGLHHFITHHLLLKQDVKNIKTLSI